MVETAMTALDEARERLIDQVLDAVTLSEVIAAQQSLRQWLEDHPDEPGMADGFELLSHREDFASDRGAESIAVAEEAVKAPVLAREQECCYEQESRLHNSCIRE